MIVNAREWLGRPGFFVAASVAVLAGALGFQYIGGIAPCVLCHWQRLPYVIVVALGAAALALPRQRAWLLFAMAAALLAGSGVALYHVGVEAGWFQGTAACGASGIAGSIAELRTQIMTAPTARCGDIAWSLFGLSLADYNLIISTLLAALAFRAAAMAAPRRSLP